MYDLFNYDFLNREGIGKISRCDIESENKLVVLCHRNRIKKRLLTQYGKPDYYGTTRSEHLGYLAYEINGAWLIVYGRTNNLPKGVEADYKKLAKAQSLSEFMEMEKEKKL